MGDYQGVTVYWKKFDILISCHGRPNLSILMCIFTHMVLLVMHPVLFIEIAIYCIISSIYERWKNPRSEKNICCVPSTYFSAALFVVAFCLGTFLLVDSVLLLEPRILQSLHAQLILLHLTMASMVEPAVLSCVANLELVMLL